MPEIIGEVEYIHPYGRGFLIYTDKEWKKGIVKVDENSIEIIDSEKIKITLDYILSIDKSINLPVLREGRAFLLVEYLNIKRRENVYLLISGESNFIRRVRFEILKNITRKQKIMYQIGEKWYPGVLLVEKDTLIISGLKGLKIDVKDIVNIERKKIEYGFRKIGVISVDYMDEEEKKNMAIFVEPIKRMFFWQLLYQVMEDYINNEIIGNLSNLEKMVLHLIHKEWEFNEIKRKLELKDEEINEIVDKFVRHGIVRKIIILKLTDKGKRAITFMGEEELE